MNRTLRILLSALLLLTVFLQSCKAGDPNDTVTTTTPEESETTAPTHDDPTPVTKKVLTSEQLGIKAHLLAVGNSSVLSAKKQSDGVVLTALKAGQSSVTVKNTYGETVTLAVRVDADGTISSVDFTPFQTPQNSVNAADYGLSESSSDNASAIQAAINALPEGGVVYIPKGTYKTSFVELKANVALRLEGILPDYNTPYSGAIDKQVDDGDTFATLVATGGDMFMNHAQGLYGRVGADNLEITGGVIDMNGKSRAFIWCCADGVLLENVIMKNCPNDHAIQIAGSQNVTVRNVLFAGYNYGNNVNGAEVIQIESTQPGAIGAVATTPSKFDTYEFYHSKNVRIENCYFGASDKYAEPTYPIGHHGQTSREAVTNLQIVDCTFDNPRIAAIRTYAFSDVKIKGCCFIAEKDNRATDMFPYLIVMDYLTGDQKMGNVYLATAAERGGAQRYEIYDNTFTIGENSKFQGVLMNTKGGITDYDVAVQTGIQKVEFYTDTPVSFTGYQTVTGRTSDLYVHDNTVTVRNTLATTLYKLKGVHGVKVEDNWIDSTLNPTVGTLDGVRITGASFENCTSAAYAKTHLVVAASSQNTTAPIVLRRDGGETRLFCTASTNAAARFSCEGDGQIEWETDENGFLYVTPVPDSGSRFDGFYVNDEKISTEQYNFTYVLEITLRFVK